MLPHLCHMHQMQKKNKQTNKQTNQKTISDTSTMLMSNILVARAFLACIDNTRQ